MKLFLQKIKLWIPTHKKTTAFIAVVAIALIVILVKTLKSNDANTTYVLGTASKGTVVSTVTGTGQVSSSNELAITPKASGTVTFVRVKSGDKVKKGQQLFSIDATDAQKSVRDAQLNLNSALAEQKKSTSGYQTAIDNAYATLLSSGLQAAAANNLTQNYAAPTISGNYTLGKEGVITLETYESTGGISFKATGLATGTGLVSSTTSQPIGDSGLFITFPSASIAGKQLWTISIPNKNSSNYISNYNNYQTALKNKTDAQDPNDTSALSIQSKRNALADARQNLSNYYVTAPFDGVIASVPVEVGDNASSATTLGTLITTDNVVTVSLNEVDIAKVKIGQKATMTFDAITDLEMTGKIASVDLLGTVTSGVVNYNVEISFDTNDERIKSGMSANVTIATNVAQDVIVIPNAAVKTANGSSYVQIAPLGSDATTTTGIELQEMPERVTVEKGISDDTYTEIKSGLSEGDIIVTKTITASTAKTTTASAPSLLGGGTGRTTTGGNATRALGR